MKISHPLVELASEIALTYNILTKLEGADRLSTRNFSLTLDVKEPATSGIVTVKNWSIASFAVVKQVWQHSWRSSILKLIPPNHKEQQQKHVSVQRSVSTTTAIRFCLFPCVKLNSIDLACVDTQHKVHPNF
ncbi:hypothetical protein BCT01_18185 [Vibrio tasmaniensis]|nr:hypothetical protein A162_22525 [Vibrio tasmaniensis 1F-155]PMO74961.1 hypothetical protein BCT01_18185 [Vibrio tasmaniensis]